MDKIRTIQEVVNEGLCHGCGTCVSLCPQSAIALCRSERQGIYLPAIDRALCRECGLCFKVCPGHEVLFQKLNLEIFGKESEDKLLGCYQSCYTGFATDYDIRFKSSSGGMVTGLLVYALERGLIDGALVTRMRQDRPLEPEPFVARTREEILEATRSKYCPVAANLGLQYILQNEGKYAVVGLPCHLHGIRKSERINQKLKERIVLHLGIFCATTISFLGTELFINRLGLKKTDIVRMDYRGNGWPGSLIIELKGNIKKQIEPFGKCLDSTFQAFAPWRCKLCIDHAAELADISLGDAWLPEIISQDKTGTSIIVTRNQPGEELLKNALNDKIIRVDRVKVDDVKRSQGHFVRKKFFIIGRFKLSRTLRKRTPDYGMAMLPCSPANYLMAVLDYLKVVLSARRNTWWLLKIYCSLLRRARSVT
jgi:coenzyme F420 hydrogenase subunit beta